MLTDLSNEQAIIHAIETNMFSFWTAYGRLPEQDILDDGRLLRFATHITHPFFNAVFGAQLTINQIDPAIRETIAYFTARTSPFYWWVGPITRPSDLGLRLQAHGLIHRADIPGMAIDLAPLPDSLPTPDGFEIVPVSDEHTLRQWSDVVSTANQMDASLFDGLYQLERSRGVASFPRYLGLLDGQPVAGSALFLDSGVAGMYAVATLEEARGKGIGSAMTLKPLLDARGQGYRVGVLQSSSMGYKGYQRLGFKKYCDLGLYIYRGVEGER